MVKSQVSGVFPPPYSPYKRQEEPIKIMIDTVLASENGLLVQPTATGKGTEAAFVARRLILFESMKGLYLYDENEGLLQARKRFKEIFGKNNISCANFFGYGKDQHVYDADMVFASYQSLNNHHDKWYETFEKDHFDFIFVNEGHHSEAFTYRTVIHYFDCPRIGMTATPIRGDGKDILDTFDKVVYEMTLEEAIANNWVADVDYRVLSHGLSTKHLKAICHEILEEGKRVSIKQLNESIFIEKLDHEILKEIYKVSCPDEYTLLQTVIFCENIKHANNMFDHLQRDGKEVRVVHSKKGKRHNQDAVEDFRNNKYQFLISVNKLNEDIDLPNVEVGIFLRATGSKTVWLQQLGRLLRRTANKHKAIILDFVANLERIIIVEDLKNKIRDLAEKIKLEDDVEFIEGSFYVSGHGFEFTFDEYSQDLLKVLERMRVGYYGTWQEASKAAIALGIENQKQYNKMYKQDPRLPSTPRNFYPDFPGWCIFLGKEKPIEKYQTCQEASDAAIALGIESQKQYYKMYKQDPRLPGDPYDFYSDFSDWYTFLGREKPIERYETCQEASDAAIALGIESGEQYNKMYKQDPRLPGDPYAFYSDFPGWVVFLGNEKYQTCQEASVAAIALGIENQKQYNKMYKQDPRLPSIPRDFYSDFPGWVVFLDNEKYQTCQEASVAAIALGIESGEQYNKMYKQDPRLPGDPYDFYSDFSDWYTFLGKEKPIEKYQTCEEASVAAIALGIDGFEQYKKMYKQDPRLPSAPNIFYKDFSDWYTFLGREKPIEKYETCQEASDAAIALGIENSGQYKKLYKQDSLLPSNPNIFYKDFPGWKKFLGKE